MTSAATIFANSEGWNCTGPKLSHRRVPAIRGARARVASKTNQMIPRHEWRPVGESAIVGGRDDKKNRDSDPDGPELIQPQPLQFGSLGRAPDHGDA